jgi:hypothetical protein
VDIIIDTIIAKEMTLRDKDELESLMYLNKVNNKIVSIFMEKSRILVLNNKTKIFELLQGIF